MSRYAAFLRGVLLLTLGIEAQQIGTAILILPGERGGGLAIDHPAGLLDGVSGTDRLLTSY